MAGRGRPRRFDRDAALATAMELFWRHGYEGASLTMLTSAMGITPTSLYAAFGSKDDLFREAVRLYNSPERSAIPKALALPRTRDAVEALLRESADAYTDPATPAGCMVFTAATNLGADRGHIGRLLADCRRDTLAEIRERIERGTAEGDMPAGADAAALACYVQTVMEGLSAQARDARPREDLDAVIDIAMLGWDAAAGAAGGS
ncbi:TetR/AcrR family transcriptional regulator [Nocardiopsis sp. CNT-189]|uniref:TetR/AcrR family transcriptional regulator n=1 Tax=Nocardiopsis oceanisediminis TaxID=2816862 RepID=UPI003B2E62F0